jgi:NADH:ubiquinone oxidoreductase subunit 2 (subunit N)
MNSEHIDFRLGYQITPQNKSAFMQYGSIKSFIYIRAYTNSPITNSVILTDSFICDSFATLTKVLVCLSSAAAIALGAHVVKRFSSYEFVILCYMAILSMLCLISSYSFLSFI